MLISPFLNEAINKFDKNVLRNVIITLFILSVIINGTIDKFFVDAGNNIFFFSFLYLLMGYIKKYSCFKDTSYKRNLMIVAISFGIYVISILVLALIGKFLNNNPSIIKNCGYFSKQNTIFTFLTSIELFLAIIKMKPFESKFINKIASATFGVYLIHDNGLMRPYIWKTIFKCQNYMYSKYLILYAIAVVFIIYIVCTIIDLIRQCTIEKLWLHTENRLYNVMEKLLKKLVKLCQMIQKRISLV